MPRINLLYCITKLELGGAQKQLLSIISGINQEKFRIFLCTASQGLLFEEARELPGLTMLPCRFLQRRINPLKDLFAFLEIYRYIKKNKIAIVHTHSSKAGILGRLAAVSSGVPVIIHTVHGWSFHEFQSRLSRACFILLERLCAGFTAKIIIVSEYDRQKGLAQGIGNLEKYQLIHYGIDFTRFGQRANREESFQRELVVGGIFCFKPQKCPQDFIKVAALVCARFKNVRFVLTGDGVLRGRIERLIRKYSLVDKIALTGWRRDIPQILSGLDIFLLTSLWEGMPVTVIEAMAASLPIVATDTGGIREIVTDGESGFLAPPQDTVGLAEKIFILLNNDSLRAKMGQNALLKLGGIFQVAQMRENHYNLYCRPAVHRGSAARVCKPLTQRKFLLFVDELPSKRSWS